MIDIKNLRLVDILPPNLANAPNVRAAAEALDQELQALSKTIDDCLILSVDKLPEAILDHLAWEKHVDFYDSSLPIEQKRQLIKNAIPWHRRKGTPAAVEELITTLFGDGEVVEWFDYGGQPYMFKVVTYNQAVAQEKAQDFTRALNSIKNKRSWLEKIEIPQSETLSLYFGGVIYIGDNITLRQVV